ncbi:AgrD family cyclic lactone autoinducer peptide [Natroniella sp. ANB-PHB2]
MKAKKVVAKVLKKISKANVASTSGTLEYQPEVPKALKKEE